MTTGVNARTLLLNTDFDVKRRLQQLHDNVTVFRYHEEKLLSRIRQLDPSKRADVERSLEIATLRKRNAMHLVNPPIRLDPDSLRDLDSIQDNLSRQYAALSMEERMLWLHNLLFIITPDVLKLDKKITDVRNQFSIGQHHNFLLGGASGMGKTTFLTWYTFNNAPEVEPERNHVPVAMINTPVSNKGPRPLLKRLIQQCGANYVSGDDEEFLLAKVVLLFQQCGVELLIADEIEHVKRHELKRRFLEISNLLPGIPIVCASVHPERLVDGDDEIAGRWNDSVTLEPFRGKRLRALLAFIELLLPFSARSFLPTHTIKSDTGKALHGPAAFIEEATDGILKYVMLLINLATTEAIKANSACLGLDTLEATWRRIQSKRR
jgi:hypothetical protein